MQNETQIVFLNSVYIRYKVAVNSEKRKGISQYNYAP